MGWYFLTHPEDFTTRVGQLSVFSQDGVANTLVIASAKSALMFNWKGDCNGWHNLSCAPQLPIPLGALFALGSGFALWSFRSEQRGRFLFLFTWLLAMLLPAVLAWEGTPHALRSIGTIPPVFLLTAVGADFAFKNLRHRFLRVAFLTVVVATCGFEYYRYFGQWTSSPDALQRSKAHLVTMASYLNSLDASVPRYVIVNDYGSLDPIDPEHPDRKIYTAAQPMIFLTQGHPKPTYLLVEELFDVTFPKGSVVLPLARDARIFQALRDRGISLIEETHEGFTIGRVQ